MKLRSQLPTYLVDVGLESDRIALRGGRTHYAAIARAKTLGAFWTTNTAHSPCRPTRAADVFSEESLPLYVRKAWVGASADPNVQLGLWELAHTAWVDREVLVTLRGTLQQAHASLEMLSSMTPDGDVLDDYRARFARITEVGIEHLRELMAGVTPRPESGIWQEQRGLRALAAIEKAAQVPAEVAVRAGRAANVRAPDADACRIGASIGVILATRADLHQAQILMITSNLPEQDFCEVKQDLLTTVDELGARMRAFVPVAFGTDNEPRR